MKRANDNGTPRCKHCGEVIGVYERTVCIVDGVARETSRAADRDFGIKCGDSYYHAACFGRLRARRLAAATSR